MYSIAWVIPLILTFFSYLGLALKKCAAYDQAEIYYEKSLNILVKVFGQKHPKVGISLYNLADIYRKKGNLDKALEVYEKSRDILVESLGDDHLEVAEVRNCLGRNFTEISDF
jgi:tetratricopeptide (TPR) repeat protein